MVPLKYSRYEFFTEMISIMKKQTNRAYLTITVYKQIADTKKKCQYIEQNIDLELQECHNKC